MTHKPFNQDPRPIGVFDSGVGGLTVLKALQAAMPGKSFIYLGDTARVPYGTKSAETVRAYATGLARVLLAENVKMIVIACNTASAHATEAVAELAAPIPVIGMVAPAVDAALQATRNDHILVMATQSTTRTACYPRALNAARQKAQTQSIAAQVLVSLVEEGWTDGPVARAAVEKYIGSYFTADAATRPDTVILGCTHFPLLKTIIAAIAGPDVTLIDSGKAAASYISTHYPARTTGIAAPTKFYVTDAVASFKPLAERFLGAPVMDIAQIDITDFSDSGRTGKQSLPRAARP